MRTQTRLRPPRRSSSRQRSPSEIAVRSIGCPMRTAHEIASLRACDSTRACPCESSCLDHRARPQKINIQRAGYRAEPGRGASGYLGATANSFLMER
jgi:hypothetical protein